MDKLREAPVEAEEEVSMGKAEIGRQAQEKSKWLVATFPQHYANTTTANTQKACR